MVPIKGPMKDAGVVKLYEPSPIPCLYVALAATKYPVPVMRLTIPDDMQNIDLSVICVFQSGLHLDIFCHIFCHDKSKLISNLKTRPEKHMKHCVLEKVL